MKETDPVNVIGALAIGGILFVGALTCFWIWIGVQMFG